MLNCTANSAVYDLPAPRVREPGFSPFFAHPYGGIARVVFVTKEGFMRFFELDEFDLRLAEAFDGKILDRLFDNHEVLGYHIHGKYSITIIDRTHGALMKHAIRTTVQNPPN